MASLSAVIVPAKILKGGRHKIRIAVSHNGETRYIVTDIIVDSSKEFKNGAVVKRPDAAFLNTKLRRLIQSYQEALDETLYIEGLSCPELIEVIRTVRNGKNHTLKTLLEEYLNNSSAKPSSKRSYETTWRTICEHLNPNMQLCQITHSTILSLDLFLKKRKLSATTRARYMNTFSFIIGYAKNCGYVAYKVDPFFKYKFPQPEVRDSWLSVEAIKKIRDLELEKKRERFCRDLFMLSYYLGGINVTDMLDIDFNVCKKTISYRRKKTIDLPKINKYVEFTIPEEAIEIINNHKGRDGKLSFPDYTAGDTMKLAKLMFDHDLKKIAAKIGLDNLIYYSARKSFSQHAFMMGINTSIIDYILGHNVKKGGSTLFNYLYVTPEMATEAIRKVLDNLK